MRICIIGDMHCKHQLNIDEPSDTLLISNKPRIPATQHPVASLLNLIRKENLTSDILLCPGDLGDKADEQGIFSSWNFLEEIKAKINAQLLLGIPGNHDINSRRKLGKDPFTFIKTFHENFPVLDQNQKSQFWDLGFCIISYQDSIFLLINTVYDHLTEEQANQSNIRLETLEKIKEDLSKPQFKVTGKKICMLHHHPIKHSNIKNWKDSDSIERGDDLVKLLHENNFDIVIHGHKHQPRIVEYNSLPIFATGSFASFANLQGTGLETMFHIVELQPNTRKGTIISWQFDILNGWSQKSNIIFPPRIGFGCTTEITKIASQIHELFINNKKRPLFYEDIVKNIEDIQFIIPEQLIQLNTLLKETYKIKTNPEYPLEPIRISEFLK